MSKSNIVLSDIEFKQGDVGRGGWGRSWMGESGTEEAK